MARRLLRRPCRRLIPPRQTKKKARFPHRAFFVALLPAGFFVRSERARERNGHNASRTSCAAGTSAFRLPPSAFRISPSAFRLPPSAFRISPSAFRLPPFAFRLSPFAFRLPPSAFRIPTVITRYPPLPTVTHRYSPLLRHAAAANKRSAVERHYKKGALHPLFLTAPPYPQSCDWSPVKNRPLRMPGERFPEHIKRRSVKKKVRKGTENSPEISLFFRRGSGCCG